MFTTINMGLTGWDQDDDPYDHNQLFQNWIKIDEHRHLEGEGRQLVGGSLEAESITSRELGDGAVGSDELQDGVVTNPKLATSAVTESKLADNSVTNPKLADNAVSTSKLQNLSVNSAKLVDNAVGQNKLDSNSVTSLKIVNGAVTEDKLSPNSVGNSKLKDGSVSTAKIQDTSIVRSKMASSSVGVGQLAQVPAAFIHRTSDYHIPFKTFQFLDFNAVKYDNDNMWDSTLKGLKVRTDGIFAISAGVRWEGPNSHDPDGPEGGRVVRLWRNSTIVAGDSPKSGESEQSGQAFTSRHHVGQIIDLRVGDYIRVEVRSSNPGGTDVKGGNFLTHLSMVWVAPLPF